MVNAAIIFLVLILFVGIGVGVYFFMKKSDNKCPDNCSDQTCSKNMCTTCSSGYGTDSSGKPDTDGSCPEYTQSTTCPPGCADTSCPDSKCTNCSFGPINSDGSCPSYSSVSRNGAAASCRTSPNEAYNPEDFDQSSKDSNGNIYYTGLTLDDCKSKCTSLTTPKPCTAVDYLYSHSSRSSSYCLLFTGKPVTAGSTSSSIPNEVCWKKN